MDSLTQIVLGAAAGEAVLGKKIGNRAMVWGAIGGTIPDLDIIANAFMSDLNALAFHRGFSHSIVFSILGAFFFGWLVKKIYESPHHRWVAIFCRAIATIAIGAILGMFLKILVPTSIIPSILAGLFILLLFIRFVKRKYFDQEYSEPAASQKDWQWLFFWSLITHPILDCFTMYGTQLFAPFSDYRVAWSTISVADPMYTVPFIFCLLIASRFNRSDRKRRFWNYLGIGLSSLYLLFTVFNKQRVDKVFAEAIKKQNIKAERFVSNAYILNNVLWTCTVESENQFYQGQYSLFDEVDIEFNSIPKNHSLVENLDSDNTLKTLRWFSDDYFSISPMSDGKYQFNDLRFGTFSGAGTNPNDFIFRFALEQLNDGSYQMSNAQGGPPEGSEKEMMGTLWSRIKGKKK